MIMQQSIPRSPLWFLLSIVLVYGVALLSLDLISTTPNPELFATGLAVDLVILVPLLFWLFIVRTGILSKVFLLPVFLLSYLGASLLLPQESRSFLTLVGFVVPIVEFTIVSIVGYRVFRVLRAGRRASAAAAERSNDFYSEIRNQLSQLIDHQKLVGPLAYEISIFYYAFSRGRKNNLQQTEAFYYHVRSSAGAIFAAILLAVLVESVALHFLLSMWSNTAVMVHLVLSIYALLFLLGDYRAIRRRPHVITPERLTLRCGIRWEVTIDRENVESVDRRSSDGVEKGMLNMSPFGAPTHVVELHEPVTVAGPYGISRRTERIGIVVDDVERFRDLLPKEEKSQTEAGL